MASVIISVVTNKGGTAKTTTAVSLGQGLAREGKRVLVIDNDNQCDTTTILMNYEPRQSLYDIYHNTKPTNLESIIQWVEVQKNLFCLPNIPKPPALTRDHPARIKRLFNSAGSDQGLFP